LIVKGQTMLLVESLHPDCLRPFLQSPVERHAQGPGDRLQSTLDYLFGQASHAAVLRGFE
jgi:hypothetical protein